MISGVAHAGVCVPNLAEAVAWYTSVLGFSLLSPAVELTAPDNEPGLGELIPDLVLRGAILGFPDSGDRVLELLEYPSHPGRPRAPDWSLTDHGLSHVGLVCDDIQSTRAHLEDRGVTFLTSGVAQVAGLRTTWFRDPYGIVYILMEKSDPSLSYYSQARG